MAWAWVLAGLVLALGLGLAGWMQRGWAQFDGPVNALLVDWRLPRAYVATPSLLALTRDVVKAPVLRELLTEDFAFYYETHEDRLSLAGALRRIAFEHDTTLADDLLGLALDTPAELAFWPDERGAARHWVLALRRGPVAQAIQSVASLAAKDHQLSLLGELTLEGGSSLPVLALRLSPRRTLALLARGERVVVLSDPGLLFNPQRQPDAQAQAVLAQLLSADSAQAGGVWRRPLGLGPQGPEHQLLVGGSLLSFNYQYFFPSVQALRLDVAAGGASLRSWVRQTGPVGGPPWAAMPAQPAACAALPVDWARVRGVLSRPAQAGNAADALARIGASLEGTAAVCWYAGSQLHTPLLVAAAKGPAPDPATLAHFMAWWQPKTVSANPAQPGDLRPALRRVGPWWLFSPDPALVQRAADTVGRRYPSVADSLGASAGQALLLAAPPRLGPMASRETMALFGPQQANMAQAARSQLLPRLAALGQLPVVQAQLSGPADANGWAALHWLPVNEGAP